MRYQMNIGGGLQRFWENFSAGGMAGAVFLSVFLVVLTLGLIFAAGYYVFKRYGLYRMAKNAGIPNAWLVFLPCADTYYLGLLAERSLYVTAGKRQPVAMVYLIVTVALYLISGISFFGLWPLAILSALGGLFLTVVKFYCLYYVFHDYVPENDVLYTVLSIIPLAAPILLLIYRNTVPVSVAGRKAGGQPKYTDRRSETAGEDATQSY